MASSIRVENVEAGYGSVRVLHGVSVSVGSGETVVLLGSNGNGKSTLIKCITGIVKPDTGSIVLEVDGVSIDLVGRQPEEIVELGISMVPEGRRLFPQLTVEENLLLGAYRGDARRHIDANLKFAMEAFPVLAERRRQLAGSMSGGEQQMLALARAMMAEPRVLLIDEPSLGLAPIMVSRTIEKIRELKERRDLTVLMAEQNFNQAIKVADRGYVIVHGEIAFDGQTADDLRNNDMIRTFYLGGGSAKAEAKPAAKPARGRKKPATAAAKKPAARKSTTGAKKPATRKRKPATRQPRKPS